MFECVCVFAAKVRRLYDIANVLRSLKLIEKVHVTEERGRKPAFEWTGPEDFPNVKGRHSSEHSLPNNTSLEGVTIHNDTITRLFTGITCPRYLHDIEVPCAIEAMLNLCYTT